MLLSWLRISQFDFGANVVLNGLLHYLGRCFGILMGWRRTHRPGDLTARIFAEHDRALARLRHSSTKPMVHHISQFKSGMAQTPDIKASRLSIRPERVALVADRAIRRMAQSSTPLIKRDRRRVVWLNTDKAGAQIATKSFEPKRPMVCRANVVAIHKIALQKKAPLLNISKTRAA